MFEKYFYPLAKEKYGDEKIMLHYLRSFFLQGMYNVVIEWIKMGMKEIEEEMADCLFRIKVS